MPLRLRHHLLVLAALLICGPAFAEHNTSQDVYIRVNNPLTRVVTKVVPVKETGAALYDVQEGAHQSVTNTTGEEIDHYYINVCADDECVPVDPVRVRN